MIFKKKQNTRENKGKVFFKENKQNRFLKRKPQKKRTFFTKAQPIKPKQRRCDPRGEKIKKIRFKNACLSISILLLIISVLIIAGYLGVNFIVNLRGGTSFEEVPSEQTYVKGIESVPVFPKSEFVYKDNSDEEIVIRMLSQGLCVYKLPRGIKTKNVYEFYEDKLPEKGWEHIDTVPVSTEEKLLGQYWVKGEKGLRIHVENSDLWYELITKNEAREALVQRRQSEITRKRVLESSTEQNLLPDYPWALSIPKEFLTKYYSTDIGELQAVEIFELEGNTRFVIYPIGKSNENPYDVLLQTFLKDFEEDWSVVNTWKDFKKEREVLYAKLSFQNNLGDGIVLMNKRNFFVYAIISNKENHPFFEEIIEKIYEP